jgi:hypothetical protein
VIIYGVAEKLNQRAMKDQLQPHETLFHPSDSRQNDKHAETVLVIACGALAREIIDIIGVNDLACIEVQCLPAKWHNTPELIVPGIAAILDKRRNDYRKVYVAYGDCGTGGLLDKLLEQYGVERINGPHCYSFYSGAQQFDRQAEAEFTAFYLTDYLARQFEKLIWEGLGLDRHPELLSDYFRHYTKLVYLAQVEDQELQAKAEDAARKLGLAYEYRFTGYGDLSDALQRLA